MTEEHDRPEPQTLADDEARRVLARASEIASVRATEMRVADLREAAREAGIPPDAFDQALIELRDGSAEPAADSAETAADTGSRVRAILLRAVGTVGLVIATLIVLMLAADLLFP